MVKKIILIILGIVVIGAVALPLYVVRELNHSVSNNSSKINFVVSEGETTSQIGDNLVQQKLIHSKLAYLSYVYFKHKSILAGEYELSANLTEKSLIDAISTGHIKISRVTIPEGYRVEQIAARLDTLKVVKYEDFIQAAKGDEGYLFPDTYEFKANITAVEVVQTMIENFNKRTAGLSVGINDLKLASIIEREAENDADRAGISGVFTNRLNVGMKLQSDVTVIYQRDQNTFKVGDKSFLFWQKLSSGDTTSVKGPYSTYQNAGLPPTPICNPGLASIRAAINPQNHNYYYFLYGKSGDIHYATSQTQQDQNANKYLY